MDQLHNLLGSLRAESKPQANPLSVFREFLTHLEQIQRKAARPPQRPPRRRRKRG
jgi:hypothetical protein